MQSDVRRVNTTDTDTAKYRRTNTRRDRERERERETVTEGLTCVYSVHTPNTRTDTHSILHALKSCFPNDGFQNKPS